MARYIDADKLLEFIESLDAVKDAINEAIRLDSVPVVHGEWIEEFSSSRSKYKTYSCSHCGSVVDYRPNYCPYCGVKMDKE